MIKISPNNDNNVKKCPVCNKPNEKGKLPPAYEITMTPLYEKKIITAGSRRPTKDYVKVVWYCKKCGKVELIKDPGVK